MCLAVRKMRGLELVEVRHTKNEECLSHDLYMQHFGPGKVLKDGAI